MGRAIILRSDEWQSSFCSSLRSDFTTGVSVIATTAEASFTTSASAATIVISSNRNAAAMRPSSRSAGMGGLRRVPDAVVEPAAPTGEPPATPETAAQDRSVVAEPASAAEQPKPPPRTDKIELTIDSLQNYELLKPIRVLVEPLGDKVFVAEAPDLNVSTSGTSVGGALILLKDHISTIYEGYTSKQNLDSERARHFKTFETYIGRPRRNWR
jgi:hypothetical protein